MENFERANKGLAQYTQSEIDELNKAFEDELRSECYQFMDPFHAEDYTEMTLDEMFREDRDGGVWWYEDDDGDLWYHEIPPTMTPTGAPLVISVKPEGKA